MLFMPHNVSYYKFIALMLIALPISLMLSDYTFAQTSKLRVTFEAKLVSNGPAISEGVEWRVFNPSIGEDGKFPLLTETNGGTQSFNMPAGVYVVHASYGHASAIRKIEIIANNNIETFIFNAGGLSLNAVAGQNVPIPNNLLRFDVYEQKLDERGKRRLIARRVLPNTIVPMPNGTYHVVSQFGDLNAEVRADLKVQAGKVTNGELVHRAARITLRLVRKEGGDALANTQWSVLNESGDLITESTSAFPNIVLSEGKYTAIAKNNETIYSHDFTTRPGFNQDVEVISQ